MTQAKEIDAARVSLVGGNSRICGSNFNELLIDTGEIAGRSRSTMLIPAVQRRRSSGFLRTDAYARGLEPAWRARRVVRSVTEERQRRCDHPDMNVLEESNCAIVPMTNNEVKASAEPAEGRAQGSRDKVDVTDGNDPCWISRALTPEEP